MIDSRYSELAKVLVEYSTELKKGDRVLIDAIDVPDEFTIALMRCARNAGAEPVVDVRHGRITRETVRDSNEGHAKLLKDIEFYRMRRMQAYIAVRGSANISELSDVPGDVMSMFTRTMRPVLNYRVSNTRWAVLRWPTPSMAQSAGMSTEAFEDFFFKVCTFDYSKMSKAMRPLEERIEKAEQVHIKGPATDLRFSIKGMNAERCDGKRNIPDGEVYTCPVKNSVNGTISFNTPTVYSGTRFENIRLEFKNGKVVDAEASDTKRLNEILDTDRGARYVGEFAFGLNPHVLKPMCDVLFDEKISGSIHFTPGRAYETVDNGNRSAVHWDMVLIQRPEWGGGEIWFDGELIRKDGLFVPKALQGLNPENLV
ncbi:MAG: aminopeptidase [Verrucomicrobia bacterium]|nr:aminopeptidase [Verrucomicrobiota bacterium]MCF7709001.1 aminopeptidase [Verrucomicrobiota bacterium]